MTILAFRLDVDQDGVATVTWDMPGRSMNVFDLAAMDELGSIVERIATEATITGAIITSGKETFSGGADLNMLDRLLGDFRAAAAAGAGSGALAASAAATTSCLRMRPPIPVPLMVARSMPLSAANLRTRGVT